MTRPRAVHSLPPRHRPLELSSASRARERSNSPVLFRLPGVVAGTRTEPRLTAQIVAHCPDIKQLVAPGTPLTSMGTSRLHALLGAPACSSVLLLRPVDVELLIACWAHQRDFAVHPRQVALPRAVLLALGRDTPERTSTRQAWAIAAHRRAVLGGFLGATTAALGRERPSVGCQVAPCQRRTGSLLPGPRLGRVGPQR